MAAVEKLVTDHLDLWTAAIKRKSAAGRGASSKIELYGIKKLRELILELAVRGLLVPQDPNDEPASELLKKIAAEKAKLVKEGKIKKEKPLPPIATEEIPFDLPNEWCWARLGEVTNYGFSDKAEPADVNEDTWVLELEDVEKETSRLLRKARFFEREFKSSKNIFKAGDVIYGKLRPYLDKVLVADEDGVCTTEMVPARAYAVVTPEFLRFSMKSPRFIEYANNATHGMNLPRVGTDKARLALIPICSEATQHRIVAKVDELMALCDQLEQQTDASLSAHQTLVETLLNALTSAADHAQFTSTWQRIAEHFDTLFTTEASIDQLKQTVLQLAVMGKLVPQDPNDEPASELLRKMAAEKALLIKEKAIRNARPLAAITSEEKFMPLPAGWSFARLNDVGDWGAGATPSRNNPELYGGDIPWFKSGELVADYISQSEETVTDLALEKASLRCNKVGDVLIAMYGATIGKTAILSVPATTNQAVCACTPFAGFENTYLLTLLKAYKPRFIGMGAGGAQPNISREKIIETVVAVPPTAEQRRIVAKVDELMVLCDRLKSRLSNAQITQLHLVDALTEKALARA